MANDHQENYIAGGFIKLYRSLTKKGYYNDSEYVHLWVHLLMKANHKKTEFLFNNKLCKLKAGQFITGRNKLALETGIHRSKIERILKCFENEQQIEQQTSNRNRIITILSWGDYQKKEQPTKQPASNQRATSEQPVSTYKNDKKNKNVNNDKNLNTDTNKEKDSTTILKKEEPLKAISLHTQMTKIYYDWHKGKPLEKTPPFNSRDGKGINNIIDYFAKNDKENKGDIFVIESFIHVLSQFEKWKPFHKGRTRAYQLGDDISNIVNDLNYGTGKQTSGISKGKEQEILNRVRGRGTEQI